VLITSLELADFSFEIIEFHELAEIQRRFGIAVIERSECAWTQCAIDEGDVRLYPILKR